MNADNQQPIGRDYKFGQYARAQGAYKQRYLERESKRLAQEDKIKKCIED